MSTRQEELMAISESTGPKRFRFYLQNSSKGLLLLRYAPAGWESAKFRIERNAKYYGLFRSMSVNELTFVKDARDYLRDVYEGQGINAEVEFRVQRLSNTTQAYVSYFTGKIDLSTYRIEETGVKVGVIDNSLTEKIKNRESTTVNLRSLTSIGGFSITPFSDEDARIEWPDFDIIGTAVWGIDADAPISTSDDHYCPMLLSTSEFTEAQSQTITGTDPLFLSSGADRTMRVTGRVTGQVQWGATLAAPKFRLHLYVNGVVVKQWLFEGSWTDFLTFDTGDISEVAAVTTGNDISLRGSAISYGETVQVTYATLLINLNETFSTVTGFSNIAYPIYEALLRTLQHLADKDDCLKSDYFGRTDTPVVTYSSDGQLGHLMRGAYIRNAIGLNDQVPVTLRDLFASLNALFFLGMGVENVGGVDKVVIESRTYFFNTTVVCDLSGKLRDDAIKKEVLPDWHYSTVKAGYNSFEYQQSEVNSEGKIQVNGTLQEYNTQGEWSTVISVLENAYDAVSKYRGDTMGIISLRAAGNAGESEKGDEDIFLVDSVRKGSAPYWTARTSEGFAAVTGGIDADQWYNLAWTPKRNLLRHGVALRAGLEHYLNSVLRFQKSDKNTRLSTRLSTEPAAVVEQDDIVANDLDEPMWFPEAYDVELDFDDDDLQAILVNPRGLVKLSQTKFGWLLSLEAGSREKKATMRLLRCNTNYVTPIES